MTKLFVVIATAGRAESLEATLRSLETCDRPAGFQCVVVVENGPRGAAKEIVERLSGVLPMQYLYHPRANKSNALNVALRAITDGLIVFLDDDVICDRALLKIYSGAAHSQGCGIFYGGAFRPLYLRGEPAAWLTPFLPYSVKGAASERTENSKTEWPPFLGFNWAAFTHDLKNAGGFDSRFGPGSVPSATGQESEMQSRLQVMGCRRRFLSEAVVHHNVPPENITPHFALHRIRRIGVHNAIVCRGPYYSMWRAVHEIVRQSIRSMGKFLLLRPQDSRFRTNYELMYAVGVFIGVCVRLCTGKAWVPSNSLKDIDRQQL